MHHLQTVKIVFLKLFLICMFKDRNLVENYTHLAEILKKIGFCRTNRTNFLNSEYSWGEYKTIDLLDQDLSVEKVDEHIKGNVEQELLKIR